MFVKFFGILHLGPFWSIHDRLGRNPASNSIRHLRQRKNFVSPMTDDIITHVYAKFEHSLKKYPFPTFFCEPILFSRPRNQVKRYNTSAG